MGKTVTTSTCGVTTCQEYSEVWEPEDTCVSDKTSFTCSSDKNGTRDTCQLDSIAQDSGISSTSDSTISYSTKNINMEMEDLSKVPWYEAEMPR